MSANLFGNSDLVWGLTTETGILIQSYSNAVSGQERLAKNHEGETVGVSEYDPMAEHTIEGLIAGTEGIANASFGAELTVANDGILTGGVSTGLIIVTGVTGSGSNEEYNSISVTARQWPLVTAAAT